MNFFPPLDLRSLFTTLGNINTNFVNYFIFITKNKMNGNENKPTFNFLSIIISIYHLCVCQLSFYSTSYLRMCNVFLV